MCPGSMAGGESRAEAERRLRREDLGDLALQPRSTVQGDRNPFADAALAAGSRGGFLEEHLDVPDSARDAMAPFSVPQVSRPAGQPVGRRRLRAGTNRRVWGECVARCRRPCILG
jgi:hypothetical protein